MRGLRVRRPMLSDPCTQLAACQLTRISPSATQKESNCVLSHSALPDTVYTQCLCHRSHLLVSEQKAIRGRLSLGEACGLVRFGVKVRARALSAAVSCSFGAEIGFHFFPKISRAKNAKIKWIHPVFALPMERRGRRGDRGGTGEGRGHRDRSRDHSPRYSSDRYSSRQRSASPRGEGVPACVQRRK